MKRVIVIAMSLGFTLSAHAAQLAMRFAPGHPSTIDDQNAVMSPGETITVEVLWMMTPFEAANNDFAGVSFNLTSVPEDPTAGIQGARIEDADLFMSNNSTSIPNWSNNDAPGTVGGLSQFNSFAFGLSDVIAIAGTTVVGTFDISVDVFASLSPHSFYIQRNPLAFSPDPANSTVSGYSYHPDGDGYNDQYNIGTGFAGFNDGTGALPLTIFVPEPAALTILALAAALVGRRRTR